MAKDWLQPAVSGVLASIQFKMTLADCGITEKSGATAI